MLEKLKHCVVSAPMLEICDSSSNTWVAVYTNTSAKALGTILFQKYTAAKYFHPIAYYSRKIIMYNIITQLQIMRYWLS